MVSKWGKKFTLRYSVDKKIDISQYQYDTKTILAYFYLGIGYSGSSLPDVNLAIESISVSVLDSNFTNLPIRSIGTHLDIESVLVGIGTRFQPYH